MCGGDTVELSVCLNMSTFGHPKNLFGLIYYSKVQPDFTMSLVMRLQQSPYPMLSVLLLGWEMVWACCLDLGLFITLQQFGFCQGQRNLRLPFQYKDIRIAKSYAAHRRWECLANVQLRMFTVVICISCVGQHKATEHIRALRLRGMMFVFCRFSKGS